MISFENIEDKLKTTVLSNDWKKLQQAFDNCTNVIMFGHGGNMGVADHGAIDISRLTSKTAIAPGSGILTTSLISDFSFTDWIKEWVKILSRSMDLSKTIAIGFSCSVGSDSSKAVVNALNECSSLGIQPFMISAQPKKLETNKINCIFTHCEYYHTSEVLSLMLVYELIHSHTEGISPPKIKVFEK